MASYLSDEQKIEIVFLYGQYRNFHEVLRQWKYHFSTDPPTVATISAIVNKFKETGSIHDRERSGRPRSAVTAEAVEQVKNLVAENSNLSISDGSSLIGMTRTSYFRTLKEAGFSSYRPTKCVELSDDDFDRRVEFCETFLAMVDKNSRLLDKIIWSDESEFKLNGCINRHNCCYWASSNPHELYPVQEFAPGVTVWCGLTSSGVIGPYFFDGNVNQHSYLAMLKDFL